MFIFLINLKLNQFIPRLIYGDEGSESSEAGSKGNDQAFLMKNSPQQ